MDTFLAILILTIVMLFGAPAVRFFRPKIGFETVPIYSILFVLIGVFFSQSGLNVVTNEVVTQIFPIIGFSLGWLGFLMTIDFDFHLIRKINTRDIVYSLIFSIFVFLFVGLGFMMIFRAFFQQISESMAWLLASLSVATSPVLLRLFIKKHRKRSALIDSVTLVTVLGGIIGVLVYGTTVSFLTEYAWWRNLAFTLLVGTGSGLFINLMIVVARKHNETLLFVYGIIFLSSGLAGLLNLSPLFVNAISGLVVANSSVKRSRVAAILYEAEQLIIVLIYVLFGALWSINFKSGGNLVVYMAAGVGVLYVLFRYSGKIFGVFVIKKIYGENTLFFANTLICQISILFALLIDFRMIVGRNAEFVNMLFLAMFFSVLLSMPIAYYFMNREFVRLSQKNV